MNILTFQHYTKMSTLVGRKITLSININHKNAIE
jgi:hypothetical protein